MADAGVARDPGRLPWLEPYRAPPKRIRSNRQPSTAALVGAAGLATVLTLLLRDAPIFTVEGPPPPQASVVLPAPVDMQPQIVLPPLAERDVEPAVAASVSAPAGRAAPRVRPRIKAVATRAAYRSTVKEQSGEPVEVAPEVSEAVVAIAALQVPPDPPRPAVNPAAEVVRGKTVQLGVYKSAGQAEAAWKSAVRDYTYLVTMPKSIEPISIRSKRYYRLQLGTPSKKHAKQLCSNLKSIGRACTVA